MNEKWSDHEDKNKIQHSLVPIVIIGAKFDAFANQFESAKKKTICLALRYISHMNGADLVFASVREKAPLSLFKALISYQIFEGGQLGKLETNQNQPINVPAG